MKGETVILNYEGEPTSTDPFGAETSEIIMQTIDNVLVQPGATQNDIDGNRPDGVVVKYTLQFPKDFIYGIDTEIFRGATITVRGNDYKVIGVPDSFDMENCPTEWCMSVEVEDYDG